ncbi:MAG: Calx-beta domain-containing protein, partial [Nitrospirota bacterium]
ADTNNAPFAAFAEKSSSGKAGPAKLEVRLSAKSGKKVTVDYAVIGGTGREGKDYVLRNGMLTFDPGETVKTIDLEVKPSAVHDDDRTVEVALKAAVNAVLSGTRTHLHLIENTVPMPTVSFKEASRTVNEDSGTITVPVTLSALSGKDVTIPFTVSGTAKERSNYRVITKNPLRIGSGSDFAEISIIIVSNAVQEQDATVVVTLGEPANARLGPSPVHTITIVDTDAKRTMAVVPFFNESGRKYAGEIVMLHFIGQLVRLGRFEIIEPGVMREKFLNMRLIMREGVNSSDIALISSSLNADLILNGNVYDYQDPLDDPSAVPKVDILAGVIERKSRKLIWAAKGYTQGDEEVLFFDVGRVYTASRLTAEISSVVQSLLVP